MTSHGVLVIGGGIAGVSAALALTERDVPVTLVERDAQLGGQASSVCCKAVAGRCQQCGGCLYAGQLQACADQTRIDIQLTTTVTSCNPSEGGFRYTLCTLDGSLEGTASAVILATGFDHVNARTKGAFGYGLLPAIISGDELERRLSEAGQAAFDTDEPRQVAFIQCVGSRDEQAGRGWCSQVCCRYGVRLARLLKARSPNTVVTVFRMDIQHCGRDSQAFDLAQKEDITFVTGLPAQIQRAGAHNEQVLLQYDDIHAGQYTSLLADLVVLSTGIQPRADAAATADLFGLERNAFGFMASAADDVRTAVPGIYLAGCCQAPRSIADSIAHARRAAAACLQDLQEQPA
ncbi:MAG: CoB--CoM heterodisulfide reductase iron-sulfur subunit A family protein [Chloroflexi bacterium]|nr:CoB--CoM heterodisulfide reductase iron-sulfur subunit A family protein [Chloroflexota bacterium]